jgi:hypothetical protein
LIPILASVVALTAAAATSDESARVTAGDRQAAKQAKVQRHARAASTPKGLSMHARQVLKGRTQQAPSTQASVPPPGSQTRYPGDLQYHGGAVLESVKSHAIFMRPNGVCEIPACWGNPEGFLRDLGKSDLIHVTDQYIGSTSNNRYTVGQRAFVDFTPQANPFTDDDMLAVVHSVAKKIGKTGYGHIYHVFLPPGTDECFDSTFSVCYSPDNFDTFFYCAYHGYADFQDIGHVLYSVEPSQAAPGCADSQLPDGSGLPNGVLVDSTDDTLSHELIEAITDPDLDAWWNSVGLGMFGQEIADECIFLDGPGAFQVGKHFWAAQTEYSNADHACIIGP